MLEITITTDSNPEGWGAECDDATAQRAAEILAEMLADEALAQWPGAEVEFGTEYVVSGGSGNLVDVSGTDDYKLIEEISREVGYCANEWWTTALEKAIA